MTCPIRLYLMFEGLWGFLLVNGSRSRRRPATQLKCPCLDFLSHLLRIIFSLSCLVYKIVQCLPTFGHTRNRGTFVFQLDQRLDPLTLALRIQPQSCCTLLKSAAGVRPRSYTGTEHALAYGHGNRELRLGLGGSTGVSVRDNSLEI